MNPSELTIVTLASDSISWVVLEGNRRIAALKLLASPSLLASLSLPTRLTKRYKDLQARTQAALPAELNCAVLQPEDARYWIQLKHTGENEGVGVVAWDGRAKQRFKGNYPPLQAIDMVESKGYLDDETKSKLPKIAISNIERVLNTPDARSLLGVDIENEALIFTGSEEEALGRLALLVIDVAHRRTRLLNSTPNSSESNMHKDCLPSHCPGLQGQRSAPLPHLQRRRQAQRSLLPRPADKVNRPANIDSEARLIPTIRPPRINKIYSELQKLDIEEFRTPARCIPVFCRT